MSLIDKILKESEDISSYHFDGEITDYMENGDLVDGTIYNKINNYLQNWVELNNTEAFSSEIFDKMIRVPEYTNEGIIFRVFFVNKDKFNKTTFKSDALNRSSNRWMSFSKSINGIKTFINAQTEAQVYENHYKIIIRQKSKYIDLANLAKEHVFDLHKGFVSVEDVISKLNNNFEIVEIF